MMPSSKLPWQSKKNSLQHFKLSLTIAHDPLEPKKFAHVSLQNLLLEDLRATYLLTVYADDRLAYASFYD